MKKKMSRVKGKIKWYNEKKGYGFISGDDGSDYFVHFTQLPKGLFNLDEGQEVNFEPYDTDRGKQAKFLELD